MTISLISTMVNLVQKIVLIYGRKYVKSFIQSVCKLYNIQVSKNLRWLRWFAVVVPRYKATRTALLVGASSIVLW